MFDIPLGVGLVVDVSEVTALSSSLTAVGMVWLVVSAVLFLVLLVAGQGAEPGDAADAESSDLELRHAA